jgi:hypothetical protein
MKSSNKACERNFSVLPIRGANYKSCKTEMQIWNIGNQIVYKLNFQN